MSSAKPTSLGIIACPGGENFANQIVSHLNGISQYSLDKKVRYIARQYGMGPEEVQRHLNLVDDLLSYRVKTVGPADSHRSPSYKIPCEFTRFANGEIKAEILRSVRGLDIYLVQDVANSTSVKIGDEWLFQSVNDHLITLMTTVDAAHQAGARRISLVLPCYPYSRQHKKRSREGLSASMIGRILENLGVARIITLDIHSREIEHAFASLVLENLHASYQILKTANSHIDLINEDLVVVSPDTGAIDRNKFFADSLYKPLALLHKERDYSKISSDASHSNITSVSLLGDVEGKTVFMADDILGTGGTLVEAMKVIRGMGARKIICTVSLPLFSGEAASYLDEVFNQGYFDLLIGTNAVNLPEAVLERPWYQSADVSSLFAKAVNRVHHNRSVSPLLDNSRIIQKMLRARERPQEPDLFSGVD
ncbi:Ribose-phosphate pyrophosphokinase [Olavius algarvensis spirochete endosymbiont]|uniref:ribose-phosphate diphosphokinase n=1 Tax=Olavius algarvensis spirochete endosymbiont TaxID=260710 RepID=UPI00052BE31A|nr:ribose-phosphate diphosphokinase [Olavius algarvensis spirochete endosymbiont]KGM43069.1 phosphoribosylpyrophosphate synthetase [Alkalispirochaeta odontotermitis]VDB00907.1 Ribose-phosphate pyrophosphokinase [Olavius algarvensis spirochete endosymbiont]